MIPIAIADLVTDKATQVRVQPDGVTITEYASAMAAGVEFPPIVVFRNNGTLWLADGFHRVGAAQQCGLDTIGADVRDGTVEDAVIFAAGALREAKTQGLRPKKSDVTRAIELLVHALDAKGELAQWSTTRIAEHVGCHQTYAAEVKSSLNLPRPDRVQGKDGKWYPATRADQSALDLAAAGELTEERAEREQRELVLREAAEVVGDRHEKTEGVEAVVGAVEQRKREEAVANTTQSKSVRWGTPVWILDLAREVAGGGFDLDPASEPAANEAVRATQIYTVEDNGLEQPWFGSVWCNPPYGTGIDPSGTKYSNIGAFTHKLVEELARGEIACAFMLCPNRFDTSWFRLWHEYTLCWFYGRVPFIEIGTGEKKAGNTTGSVLLYAGPEQQLFAQSFAPYGRITPPRAVTDEWLGVVP